MKTKSARRNFIKNASLGMGAFSLAPFFQPSPEEPACGPANISSGKKLNVVCLGAHPGDPEFGCGGTMAKFAAAGHTVRFIYLTRGEAGDPSKSFAESAALRTREAEYACQLLNVKALFAGQTDGNTVLSNDMNREMSKMILTEKPDLLFTQWPIDTHPDHQVTGMLALTAWAKSGRAFPLYFYEVNTGSETMSFTPTDYVDITNFRDLKKQAMFAHKTQDPVQTYDSYFKPLEEFRGLESGVKAAEAFIHFKDKTSRATMPGI